MGREAAPRQQTLKVDRGQQLRALRALRLPLLNDGQRKRRDPTGKHLLRALDDHIGADWQDRWFTIPVEVLADECEIGRAAAAEALHRLDLAGFIQWDRRQGRAARFKLCWGVIFKAVEAQEGNPSEGEEIRSTDFGCPSEGREIRSTDFPYKEEAPLSAQESASQAPPPPTPPRRTDQPTDAVVERVAKAGVRYPGQCVAKARARGLTDALVLAIVDHFERFPGRWQPGALFDRLAYAGTPNTPADELWPEDSPAWIAAQQQDEGRRRREVFEAQQRAADAEYHRRCAEARHARSPPDLVGAHAGAPASSAVDQVHSLPPAKDRR